MKLFTQLRQFLDARLQPQYLLVVAGAIVALSQVLAAVQFVTSDQGQTVFGVPLGADFSGFYVAAEILNRGQPEQLYNRELHHRLYHELLPHENERVSIPYVHPPFVAGLLRPLASIPYPIAVAIWFVTSAVLYLASIEIIRNTIDRPDPKQRWLILLLAFSFEPFAFECWLGGQLSAIASFSYALCFTAIQRSRPFLAGAALGLCFYKPTLLILILPMLICGRRWKVLLGMSSTGLALVGLSLIFVGWDVTLSYANELLTFSKSTSGGELEIRTWKYVDLNNSLRLALGRGSRLQVPLLASIGIVPFLILGRFWWRSARFDIEFQRILWATTLTWIPVLNFYVGIYDSILVVQSVLITATAVCLREKHLTPLTRSGFAYLILLIYGAPWFSQNLAAMTGIPTYTVLLMVLGTIQFKQLYEMARIQEN